MSVRIPSLMVRPRSCRAFELSLGVLAGALWTGAAFAQGGGGGLGERQKDREATRWYFTDVMGAKRQSKNLDLLYRFYVSEREKPKPRLEPTFLGVGGTGWARMTDPADSGGVTGGNAAPGAAPESDGTKRSFTSVGFGGSVFFNNFIVGTLGIPMPNLTLGVDGFRREETHEGRRSDVVSYAPSLRLFGKHQQDSALFVNYRYLARDVFSERFKAWAWEGAARFYLFPQLCAEGSYLVPEERLKGASSDVATLGAHSYGGYMEFYMFRLGVRAEFTRFEHRESGRVLVEERTMGFLGFSL